MPKFTGKFEYLVDGKKVTQEQFQQLVDGREENYNISIDNLRVVASGKGYKSEPFFLDEFLFPAHKTVSDEDLLNGIFKPHLVGSEFKKEWELKPSARYVIGIDPWKSDGTGSTVFEKVQDSTLDTYNAIVGHSTRHKTVGTIYEPKVETKEIKLEDVCWSDEKRKAVNQMIIKHKESQTTEQKQQVKNLSEKYKKEDLDYLKKQLLNSGLFLSLEDSTLIFSALTKEELKPLIERMENCKGVHDNFGKKDNKNKPQLSILFKQFPKALEALAKCSEYGNQKYKETDKDFLNFKRVSGGSKTYADAGLRHRLETGLDESGLPHQYHVCWNALAELQLWIEENEN